MSKSTKPTADTSAHVTETTPGATTEETLAELLRAPADDFVAQLVELHEAAWRSYTAAIRAGLPMSGSTNRTTF